MKCRVKSSECKFQAVFVLENTLILAIFNLILETKVRIYPIHNAGRMDMWNVTRRRGSKSIIGYCERVLDQCLYFIKSWKKKWRLWILERIVQEEYIGNFSVGTNICRVYSLLTEKKVS